MPALVWRDLRGTQPLKDSNQISDDRSQASRGFGDLKTLLKTKVR